jgi:hypothetical protein
MLDCEFAKPIGGNFSLLLFLVPFLKPGAEHVVSSTRSIDQKQFIFNVYLLA